MEGTHPVNDNWNKVIPWFLTIASSVVLTAIAIFLVVSIQWFKESALDEHIHQVNTSKHRLDVYFLYMSMIKRSVGLFSGFAIMFLGMAAAFFTLKDNINIKAGNSTFSTQLVTASPGIVALLMGGYLIIATIQSKDHFAPYGNDTVVIKNNGKDKNAVNRVTAPRVPETKRDKDGWGE